MRVGYRERIVTGVRVAWCSGADGGAGGEEDLLQAGAVEGEDCAGGGDEEMVVCRKGGGGVAGRRRWSGCTEVVSLGGRGGTWVDGGRAGHGRNVLILYANLRNWKGRVRENVIEGSMRRTCPGL